MPEPAPGVEKGGVDGKTVAGAGVATKAALGDITLDLIILSQRIAFASCSLFISLRPRQSRAKNWVVERGAVGVRSGVLNDSTQEADWAAVLELLRQGLPGLQAVYHFGSSAAQGAEHEGSDVDLAVLPEGPLSPLTRFALAGACARRLHREVDLVDLASASTVLAEQVIESGRLLYARNPAAVAGFEVAVLGKYCQLNEERRELLADIQQRGGIYGR